MVVVDWNSRTSDPPSFSPSPLLLSFFCASRFCGRRYDVEDHLSFKVSCDGDVYVCVDAHAKKPAPWLRFAGFRGTSSRARTSDGVYALHHRFYAKVNQHPILLCLNCSCTRAHAAFFCSTKAQSLWHTHCGWRT